MLLLMLSAQGVGFEPKSAEQIWRGFERLHGQETHQEP